MIIKDFAVGNDSHGKELRCGDICKYNIKDEEMKGMIIYDEDTYSFAFEQLDDNFPIILMSAIERETIEKIANVENLTSDFPQSNKWQELYYIFSH